MSNTFYVIPKDSDLTHYGVLGMKWGVRRYQNVDGSLTSEGKKKYLKGSNISRIIGTAAGGALAGYLIGKRAEKQQIQSNIEKEERRQEAEAAAQMTDTELREFNQRKSLEKQLNDIFSSENEKMGNNYVKELLNLVGSGANIVKNVTDTTITLSTASKKEKDAQIQSIKNANKAKIAAIEKENAEGKKREIAMYQKMQQNGKITKNELGERIKLINKTYKTELNNLKKMQNNKQQAEIKNINDRIAYQMTTKNKAGIASQLVNMTGNTLSGLSKAYSSGANIDTSRLSNRELQQLVDRARMEQQYLNIVTPANTRDGIQYVSDVMSSVAQATGIGSQLIGAYKTLRS